MKIKYTTRGFQKIEFKDNAGEKCSIQKSSSITEQIWLGIDNIKITEFYPTPRDTDEAWFEIPIDEVEAKLKHRPQNEIHIFSRMLLTKKQVKKLLPHLQNFVETGDL